MRHSQELLRNCFSIEKRTELIVNCFEGKPVSAKIHELEEKKNYNDKWGFGSFAYEKFILRSHGFLRN